ncbi:hypothetical protein DOT_3579 [Desulfosporosinus sp. OT]|nr:hypothetical protein DOT_3579 [Desulfosporosinus sp. OT]
MRGVEMKALANAKTKSQNVKTYWQSLIIKFLIFVAGRVKT